MMTHATQTRPTPEGLRSALLALALALPLFAAASPAQPPTTSTSAPGSPTYADEGAYRRTLHAHDFKSYDRATVQAIQHDLATIYHDHPDWIRDLNSGKKPLTDGRMGPVTLSWMQRYCFNFKCFPANDFVAHLPARIARIAAFARQRPREQNILVDADFERWNAQLPAPQRSRDYLIRRQGSAAELLALVQRYLHSKSVRAAPLPETVEPLSTYTYVLNAADLERLQGKDQLMSALLPLQDQPFDDLGALKSATAEALKAIPGAFKNVWPVVENNSRSVTTYRIDDAVLLALAQAGLPSTAIKALEPLKDAKPASKADFQARVAAALKTAPAHSAASETEAVPRDEATTERMIVLEAEQSSEVSLNEAALSAIKNQLPAALTRLTLPTKIVDLLRQLQEVEYPERVLLHRAAQAKIAAGIGACPGDTPSYNKYLIDLRLADADFAALKNELLASSGGDAASAQRLRDSFNVLEQLRAGQKTCSVPEREQRNAALGAVYDHYVRASVDILARKQYDYSSQPVRWDGGSCGCVLDELAGTVYGFYPFWKNRAENEQALPVNFSVMSRVAYYGLTFDEMGELKHSNNRNAASLIDVNEIDGNAFIREARKHNTQVDWVVERNDWHGAWARYSPSHRAAILDRLSHNIVRLLTTPLTDPFSRIKPYVSFGGSRTPTRGDGVTLYFKDYPQDAESTDLFNAFFQTLKKRLGAIHDDYFVNILVAQTALGSRDGAYSYANLLKLSRLGQTHIDDQDELEEEEIREQINSHVLVLIEEPSAEAKKRLRQNIEDHLHGEEREDLMRSVLPVFVFDRQDWVRMQDDLIYVNGVFGGVGFWSLVTDQDVSKTASCVESKNLAQCLIKRFEAQGASSEPDSALEKFVCEYRWPFRLALDLSLLALALAVVLYFRSCAIRSKAAPYMPLYLLAFGLPPVILFTLLLFFDPALSALSRGNWPFIVALALLVSSAFATFLYLRGQREVPSRAVLKTLIHTKESGPKR